ncbi:MAG: hypothetical protein ABIV21_09780, partial [Pyrinomonadaceae bacterium]
GRRAYSSFAGLLVFSFVLGGLRLPVEAQIAAPPAGRAAANSTFRVEKVPVAGGSEIISIFARVPTRKESPAGETPLVSVLRDTLGDDIPENDRLRYVWMLTYTRPSLSQKLGALIPFLYARAGSRKNVGSKPPPVIMDVQASDRAIWDAIFWMAIKRLILGEFGVGVKASASQYHQNVTDNRRAAIASALAVLSLYQEIHGSKVLSDVEFSDIHARLALTNTTFGGLMQSENLGRAYTKSVTKTRDVRGHNWELLRQYSEAQHLYFEPLEMPDGSPTHAILWTSAEDIAANQGRAFERRFLNIKNPWTDDRLRAWKGYTQARWYDAEDRQVDEGTPGAKRRTMIPLAIYGLDHPKIPAILIDFRDSKNPKRREITRRILADLTGSVVSLSGLGGVPFFLGRFVYEFATGRRGMDLNQTSRMRSYSQLKLLLSLDASLDSGFRRDVERRLGSVGVNPLENDMADETLIAKQQYANLLAYAARPDGLPAKVLNDRREEMVKLKHGGTDRTLFTIAHVLSFGMYNHRESSTPELVAQLDARRQLDYHERVISEVAFASARPEIDSNTEALNRSLLYISEHGAAARDKSSRSLAKIFAMTAQEDTRSLCLMGLYRINNSSAKKELLAIYNRPNIPERWHELSAVYLKLALEEGQQISARDAERITAITAN